MPPTPRNWTVTFCTRNEATCTQAASLWDQFVKKAEFGAKLAYDAFAEKAGPSGIETGTVRQPERKAAAQTLKRSDLEPVRRGSITVKPPVR